MRTPLSNALAICVFTALASAPSLPPQAQARSHLALKPCEWATKENPALCGEYSVFEDRASRKGRKIPLRIVVFPARREPKQLDPVYFLDGGPSDAAADKAKFLPADALAELRATRDLVFVNQRGTGEGAALDCDMAGGRSGAAPFTQDLFPVEPLKQCVAKWQADPRLYTTSLSADDIEEVRAALGAPQLNLWGVSYGTRLAQEYARRYPARTRTITLDGVLALPERMPVNFARGTHRAMDRLIADCAADVGCARAYPRLREMFEQVLVQLAKQPAPATHTDRNGATERVTVTRELFAATLRTMLYSTERQRRIPWFISQAAQDKFDDFVGQAVRIRSGHFDGLGMYLALVCTEDVAHVSPLEAKQAAAGTFLGTYWWDQISRACGHVPRGTIPADFREPLKSSVPALLFSGYLDPTTPPEWGDVTARHLPNGLHVEMRYGSHSFHPKDEACSDNVVTNFIQRGAVKNLDTTCLRQIQRPPFVMP